MLPYLHGAENIVPGLEAALLGRSVGDSLEVEVAAADGYGERASKPFKIPRNQFPPDVELEPGMDFVIENDQGEQRVHWVMELDDTAVLVDGNHPLAGIDLFFSVEIVGIRDATEVELDHGHPHGPDGQGHHH